MGIKEVLPKLRRDRNLTQQELAQKLFVTRQAISRWETGETTPGIDMCKLIAQVLTVPLTCLLEAGDTPLCQSCGMPLGKTADRGSETDGSTSHDYCKYCYDKGKFRRNVSMDELIESCAPLLMQHTHMSLDETVSLMGALLSSLKRWLETEDETS